MGMQPVPTTLPTSTLSSWSSVDEIRMLHNELYVQEAQPLMHRYVWFM